MGKILRLHDGLHASGDTQRGWDESDVIGIDAINSIEDPEDSTSKKEITSIPSPFARMDLVRQAFKYIVDKKLTADSTGKTMYHKLVSDALDIGEIFFNIDKYLGKDFEVAVWSLDNIERLKTMPGSPEAQLLGNTLDLFVDSDMKNTRKFDNNGVEIPSCHLGNIQDIYILKYIGKGAPEDSALGDHIVGATSPYTLFFTPAGDLSYVSRQVLFEGNDRPLDGEFNPLCNRDHEYIKYLVWLNSHPYFPKHYPEVSAYIESTVTNCHSKDAVFGNELRTITPDTKLSVSQMILPNGSEVCLPGGYPINHKVIYGDIIEQQSEFVIRPNVSKVITGNRPLVLPLDQSCRGLVYTMAKWDGTLASEVPVVDFAPLDKRVLPGLEINYPYLTIGDFLEPKLIRTSFSQKSFIDTLEEDYFLLGKENGLDNYLLPIKKEYFRYFDINDLRQNLRVEKKGDGDETTIVVSLTIPIVGNNSTKSVTYQRIYSEREPSNEKKFGQIIDVWATGVTLFPHAKIDVAQDFRVTLYVAPNLSNERPVNELPTLAFVNSRASVDSNLSVGEYISRNQTADGSIIDKSSIVSRTWKVSESFDLIEVIFDGVKNLIIPILHSEPSTKIFSFAVDFGTTNTHIEYSINGSPAAQPLDITDDDAQIKPTKGLNTFANPKKVQEGDLMPARLGKSYDVSFPIRTALTFQKGTDWGKDTYPFLQANIPFYYERKSLPKYNEIPVTDLKWQTGDKANDKATRDVQIAQLANYVMNLAFIMRNKVLMNGGDLEKTKIIWFYPTSMKGRNVGELDEIWQDAYKKYFNSPSGHSENVCCIPEAVAPLSYYKNATTDALTIDIGGGTSDFLFAEDKQVKYISSARFASNGLFGDGLNKINFDNGIIKYFCEIIEAKLEGHSEQLEVLNSIKEGVNASANLASFFFSLKSNPAFSSEQERKNLDFTQMLAKSPESSSIILLFYMSLIYYCARVTKAKGLKEPRYIGFSGNGSKVLEIFFGNSVSRQCIIKISQGIFENVLGRRYDSDGLDILQAKGNSPKEATAQGGLAILNDDKYKQYGSTFVREHSLTLLGTIDDDIVGGGKYEKKGSIDPVAFEGVINSIHDFVNISRDVLDKCYASDELGVLATKDIFDNSAFERDLEKYIRDGLLNENLKDEDTIPTSLFFYAIEGILHRLGNDLFKIISA